MNKTTKNGMFIALAIILGIGAIYIINVFTKAPPDASKMKPDVVIEADTFFKAFEENEEKSNELYLDKLIQVEGRVGEVISNNTGELNIIIRDEDAIAGISCSFDPDEQEKLHRIAVDDKIIVKGFCTGMLMDVVLNRCVLVEE